MSQISILHPITRLIVGGAQENTIFTAALLDQSKYQVEIISGPQTGSEGSLIDEVKARGIHLTILPQLVRQVSPINDGLALWKLYRHIRSHRYNIVHTHSSKAGILGRIAARLAGTPVIVHTVHGWSFHDHMPIRTKQAYIHLEKLCASFSQALIVVAEKDIEKGLKEGIGRPDQYHLIRSAIPLNEYNPDIVDGLTVRKELNIPLEAPVLGNVGRFSSQKNPLDWVSVAKIVGENLPDCRFLLVGDGPLRQEVEGLLKQGGILDRTIFTGLRRDVPRLLAAMNVFLLTSLWEGLPRVIPQSFAMRIPVVAYRVDGIAEMINHDQTGFLHPPGSVDEMASDCLKLLTNPSLREIMGRSCRELAINEYDVTAMVRQIDELYQILLKIDPLKG